MTNFIQGFPKTSAKFVDISNGFITQPWYQFLISIWLRTGEEVGGNLFVPGDIKASASTAPQNGWLLCDGAAYNRTLFAALFTTIGIKWGAGDLSATFNVPDLRGRMLIGVGSGYPIGQVGGVSSVTLTTNNLPTHNHTITDPGHFHTIPTGSSAGSAAYTQNEITATTSDTGTSTTGITVDNAGYGVGFPTISPYAAIQYLIKT